jgi:arylsulfatase A-like enzyme
MMTGLSPSVHLVSSVRSVLSDRVTTLAESLREHGYHTAAIVHNPLLDPDRNFAQGFDEYVDLRPPSFGDSVGARVLQTVWPGAYPPSAPSTQGHAARTVEWLEANRDRSFFLWVHFFDPHAPYEPDRTYMTADPPAGLGFRFDEDKLLATGVLLPPPDARQWIRSLYQAEVRGVDAAVSGVIAALERMKLYDGSLIVLTSDHGEEFWDHGGQGHGHTLFDELLRVPLVVKLPGSSHRGRVATTVSTASVMPTVLDLSGIRYDRESLTASSLAPLLTPGGEWSEDPHVVSTVVWATGALADSQEAVHFGQLKAIVRRSDGLATLYDTAIDPAERHSLAASNPDRLETGRQLLERHGEEAAALRRRLRVEEGSLTLDDNTLRQLRSLGYVQ